MVRLKNTLALHVFVNELIEELIKFVKSIPKYQELKLDGELLKNLMKQIKKKLLENKTLTDKQKEDEVDKTSIILEVYKTVFTDISLELLDKIEKDIKFLVQNKIVKKKNFKRYYQVAKNLLVNVLNFPLIKYEGQLKHISIMTILNKIKYETIKQIVVFKSLEFIGLDAKIILIIMILI